MTHTNSDPVPEEPNYLKSAITNSPPITTTSMISHHGGNDVHLSHQLYSPNYVHPPPLENRNSAPEIVVLSPGRELPKIPMQAEQHQISQNSSKKNFNSSYGVEDRIHRAKAKVFQNGGFFRSSSKDSTYYVDEDVATQLASPIYQSAATSIPPGPSSTGSGHVRQKLSTRFHSAQKLNYKLAALSSFASAASANINVRRSRTFNISDMHEQLNVVGNGGCGNGGNIYDTNDSITNASYYTKTLPKQMKTSSGSSPRKTQTLRKQQPTTLTVTAGARDSNSSSSSGVCCGSYSSDITTTTTGSSNGTDSVGDIGSGASSTASSRKSSNSSSKDETTIEEDGTGTEVRTDISENALQEIAAFESFIASYVVQQTKEQPHQSHCSLSSTKSPCNTGCGGKSCCMALSGSRTMGANMKCHGGKSQLAIPSSIPNKAGIPPSGSRGRRMIASGGVVRTLERQKKITSMSSQTSEDA